MFRRSEQLTILINKLFVLFIILVLSSCKYSNKEEEGVHQESECDIVMNSFSKEIQFLEIMSEKQFVDYLKRHELTPPLSDSVFLNYLLEIEGQKKVPKEKFLNFLGLNECDFQDARIFGTYFQKTRTHVLGTFQIINAYGSREMFVVYDARNGKLVDRFMIQKSMKFDNCYFVLANVVFKNDEIWIKYLNHVNINSPRWHLKKPYFIDRLKITKTGFHHIPAR